jgi:hypothetical protein
MKTTFTLLLFAFYFGTSAQSVSTSVKFDKSNKPALMLYLPYNQEIAEGTILTKLKEIGFEPETSGSLFWKQSKVNGFYAFKGVALKGDKSELVDLYFKVDRRGSKKDNQSVMYLLTSKGADNFISDASDAGIYSASQRFLNGFVNETATYKHTLDVKSQEETVAKTEKKLAGLMDEEKDLTKKIAKLQDDLRKNKEDQAKQQMVIETERRKLDGMRQVKQ